jgi:putative FmdB family regulatory protein
MPTYEYVCRACGHEFEEFQRMSDAPVKICPKCEESAVDRLISTGGGILFKGTGFYATDYRKDGPPKDSKDSGDSRDSDRSSGSSKSGRDGSKTTDSGDSGAKGAAPGTGGEKGGSD